MSREFSQLPEIKKLSERRKRRQSSWVADYSIYDSAGSVVGTKCFSCGTQIHGYVVVSSERQRNGVIRERVALRPYAAFDKLDMVLSNGSIMSPMVCKDCKHKLRGLSLSDPEIKSDILATMVEAHAHVLIRNKRNPQDIEEALKPLMKVSVERVL